VVFPPFVLKLSIVNACAGETATDEAANAAAAAHNATAANRSCIQRRVMIPPPPIPRSINRKLEHDPQK
jgi:hypothetical protein